MSDRVADWPSFVTLVLDESFRVFDEFESVSSFDCWSNFWTVPVSCLLLAELEVPGVLLEAVEPLEPVPMSVELPLEPLVPVPVEPDVSVPVELEPVPVDDEPVPVDDESVDEPVPIEPEEPLPVVLELDEPVPIEPDELLVDGSLEVDELDCAKPGCAATSNPAIPRPATVPQPKCFM